MTSFAHRTALVWLRRDLRLADNPALAHACERAERVVPIYIHEPEDEQGKWAQGAATRWWLHHSLEAMQAAIKAIGGRLIIRQGVASEIIQHLIKETSATLVTWNRLYEPDAIKRDQHLKAALKRADIAVESFNGGLLLEPWTLRTGGGTPYRVFTPFWRACLPKLAELPRPLPAPKELASNRIKTQDLDDLKLKPTIGWDKGLIEIWRPGEAAASERLRTFAKQSVGDYPTDRNRPDLLGTSRLSPHLHFGEISPRQIVHRLLDDPKAEPYVRQIVWREFAHHLLYHFPQTANEPLDEKFRHYAWSKDAAALRAWQRGQTGIPIVDAGMRELWHTGWMHNRIRMCAASFLTKNLRIHWLEGARWFWDTLVDADLANNTLGWQWVAGCGADAAPYYRIFNPTLQAEKFDPERQYIRHWVPEISALPDRWIHRPWEAPEEVLKEAKVKLGRGGYPRPIADLRESRTAALDGYKKMQNRNHKR